MKARIWLVSALTALMTLVGGALVAGPAAAVGCYGVDCDNQGPKGNGCFPDARTLAVNNDGHLKLRYSTACRAFWVYADWELAPSFWDAVFEIDLQKKDANGNWQHYKTLSATHSVGEGDDWTNMLGARTRDFRFRGYYDYQFGGGVMATGWVLGGTH
jgi:hypothetical protein